MTARPAASAIEGLLSRRGRAASGARGGERAAISFSGGFPDPASQPRESIIEATARALRGGEEWPLQYGPTFGYDPLRDFLIEKLGRDQAIRCERDNLLLTAGGAQAFRFLCDLFLDPGDTVLSEAPTWLGAVKTLRTALATVEEIPLDEGGVRVDTLEQTLVGLRERGIRPKLFYTIPNFQNPFGATTRLERRRRIIELAEEFGFAIVEDDAYFDLRFAGEKLPTLYELDGGRHVLYFGTFSKILAAGMRLGWIVGPPGLIGRLGALSDGSLSPFVSHVAYEACKGGALEERVGQLIALYQRRRDVMLGELEERMPEGVSWTVPDGGFFIWVTLPAGVDSVRLLEASRVRGVDFLPGTACFFNGSGRGFLRLAYSHAADEDVARGIGVLANLIAEGIRSRD